MQPKNGKKANVAEAQREWVCTHTHLLIQFSPQSSQSASKLFKPVYLTTELNTNNLRILILLFLPNIKWHKHLAITSILYRDGKSRFIVVSTPDRCCILV